MSQSTLYAIELLVGDAQFQGRLRAGVAKEATAGSIPKQSDIPDAVYLKRYDLCSAPGWGDAYLYALETGVSDPGADNAVITDAQISSQVQVVFPLPPPPEVPPTTLPADEGENG
jgi:hypothetical protein